MLIIKLCCEIEFNFEINRLVNEFNVTQLVKINKKLKVLIMLVSFWIKDVFILRFNEVTINESKINNCSID